MLYYCRRKCLAQKHLLSHTTHMAIACPEKATGEGTQLVKDLAERIPHSCKHEGLINPPTTYTILFYFQRILHHSCCFMCFLVDGCPVHFVALIFTADMQLFLFHDKNFFCISMIDKILKNSLHFLDPK